MRSLLGAVSAAAILFGLAAPSQAASPPQLLRHPSLSAGEIAFDYAGEIWAVSRDGGPARLVVAGQGRNSGPIFSPDGRWIAYTGTYDGNTDVYVVSAAGGEPRRLTWHPGVDAALGWTPDGKGVLFESTRSSHRDLAQLYVAPVDGGAPEALPLPSGDMASFSPDATHLAYMPFFQVEPAWKHYRGGQTSRIWIADLSDSRVEKVPRDNSNDKNPMWAGDKVYFLSDRDGPVTLYSYDVRTKAVAKLVDNAGGFDMASASAGPGGIVIDHFGRLEIYDLATGATHKVPVTVSAELPQLRARFVAIKPDQVRRAAITASGRRVLIEAHGEILSVPAEKGDIRNLTQSPGVADRDPAASPDGKSVAWFSDESGEYALHIGPADGLGPVRKISLGEPPSFFYRPRWSPDSKKIVYSDRRQDLWVLDVATGKPARIDADPLDGGPLDFEPAWSPDSRWLVYTKQAPNHLATAWIWSAETGKTVQVTDARSDVISPRFDRSGDYLFFAASTSEGLATGDGMMSSMGRPVDASVYAMVLRKDQASPVAPESDEEGAALDPGKPNPDAAVANNDDDNKSKDAGEEKASGKGEAKGKGGKASEAPKVRIDFEGLEQRIVAMPIPHANIRCLETGEKGIIFTCVAPTALSDGDYEGEGGGRSEDVFRFDLKARKSEAFAHDVRQGSFSVSADGTKVLFARKDDWFLTGADKAPQGQDGALKLASMSVWVDPRAEWRQMYHEVWRIERDFLYDPKAQGLDLAKAEKLYAPFLDGLGGRGDLNTLFEEMTGQIGIGHMFIRGGMFPEQAKAPVGLLGADFEAVDGRWRIKRVLKGENWNPQLVAPLTLPGVNVSEGEFLLAVNGRDVRADSEVYRAFEGLAGKQTVLTVGPKADGTGSRRVTVVPIANEAALRLVTWMEDNRRKVDQLSGGKLAYVYLPDTANGGFVNFNRYYFSQTDKQGAVIDERFNHGGYLADFIIEQMKRTPLMVGQTRYGVATVFPSSAIFGPKVMIINQMSGSGGDAMPWIFKNNHVGPLVGVRTWGGLVGIGGYPELIDGGSVTAPHWALYGLDGHWDVENIGIAPDIEVEDDPALVRQGHDPQLERAVQTALDALAANPPPVYRHPDPVDRHAVLPDPVDRP
jgi:tricorn protease